MSPYTIAGMLVGVGLFIMSILLSTDNGLVFFSVPSLLLVVGGTLANAFISYEPRTVTDSLRDIGRMFGRSLMRADVVRGEAARVVEWARVFQTQGIRGLENHLRQSGLLDPLLEFGVTLVVDGHRPADVREMMGNLVESEYFRRASRVVVLRNMASTAPAFGMVGTLVGLVIMLDGLARDPAALGSGLAVALLTTLYGVLLARLVFQPAADKTLERERLIRFRNYLMLEGFTMIAEGRRPLFVETRMNSFLDPSNPINVRRPPVQPSTTEA
jgi:chemotaxis protein MotA